MQIDWFTLVAQIVNFLILLYLLRRFLYQPILNTMDQRERDIADRLKQAEDKQTEADQQAERYRQQQQELQETRQEKLAEIQQDVEDQRKQLLAEARQEVQSKKRDWQESLRREQESFLQDLRLRVGQQAVEVARRALKDLGNAEFEDQMAGQFITRIRDLAPAARDEISDSIRKSDQDAVVRSSFDLPDELKSQITAELQQQIAGKTEFKPRFERSPDLISGIELQVAGHRVAWTIRDYLNGIEKQIAQVLEREDEQPDGAEDGG